MHPHVPGAMIQPATGGVVVSVRVVTRAGKSGLAGVRGDAVLVRLHAPPVEGAANAELLDVIARALDVPRRDVRILSGERSKQKRVHVAGIDATATMARLALQ